MKHSSKPPSVFGRRTLYPTTSFLEKEKRRDLTITPYEGRDLMPKDLIMSKLKA
jgi:hypothetical protein